MKLILKIAIAIIGVVIVMLLLMGMTKSPIHGLLAVGGMAFIALGVFVKTKWHTRITMLVAGVFIIILAMAM